MPLGGVVLQRADEVPTQAVAEELPTAIDSIRIVLADTSLVPWEAGTFGSRSTPDM
ncbi:MAG: molybdopterin cofactor-binding domain-containing protein, partial [Opitutaceae bacterium]